MASSQHQAPSGGLGSRFLCGLLCGLGGSSPSPAPSGNKADSRGLALSAALAHKQAASEAIIDCPPPYIAPVVPESPKIAAVAAVTPAPVVPDASSFSGAACTATMQDAAPTQDPESPQEQQPALAVTGTSPARARSPARSPATASLRRACPERPAAPAAEPEPAPEPEQKAAAAAAQEQAEDVVPCAAPKLAKAKQGEAAERPSSRAGASHLSSRPSSRSSVRANAALQAALQDLALTVPADAVADMDVIKAAADEDRESMEAQLGVVVPLLVRALRAPRLATARAAIATFSHLFAVYGDVMCGPCSDDSSPTTSAVLALMQKATGGDLNSRRIAAEANDCLIVMVECVTPEECIALFQNYCTNVDQARQNNGRIRAKAAAVLAATAYRLLATDLAAMDTPLMGKLLKLCDPLLADGAACRLAAQKLALVVYSAHSQNCQGEDWATFVKLHVEPEAAQAIKQVVAEFGVQGQDLDGFVLGDSMGDVISRLIQC